MCSDHVGTERTAHKSSGGFARLSSVALMFLRLESDAWPCHFGGLAVLEGETLLDATGQLRIEEIRDQMARRLTQIPELRRRVHFPGLLGGRPLWVDDDRFAIEHHVFEIAVASPGGDGELLETAAQIYEGLLDRGGPLWELWFLTGLSEHRVGVLLKLHHAVADGLAAVAIMGSLFDFEPDAPEPDLVPWTPEPIPGAWPLLVDTLSSKIQTLRRAIAALSHPLRLLRQVRAFAVMTRRYFEKTAAPASSLNEPVRPGRLIRFLRLDVARMREAAHSHEAKVNDLVLTLWVGGLRRLLTQRGESVAGVELISGMPVSLRSDETIDNQVGTMVLALPVWQADPSYRLELIARRTRTAKTEQQPAAIMGYMAGLAATPIGRYYTTHQRASNVIVTNVMGPSVPVYVLGARILEILPIIELVGNIGLTLCAFSYSGEMFMVVTADATAFPDLEVLMEGMEQDWHTLTRRRISAVPG
ncbi:MAG TPA: wax ester/triacylglycerol synthase family O-acyltransferase [Acidimicrobiia bacterium]